MKKLFNYPFIILIKLYQWLISPLLPNACRFTPTCSNYALQALHKYGVFKGGWFALKRISKCHPWGGYGHDPLP